MTVAVFIWTLISLKLEYCPPTVCPMQLHMCLRQTLLDPVNLKCPLLLSTLVCTHTHIHTHSDVYIPLDNVSLGPVWQQFVTRWA